MARTIKLGMFEWDEDKASANAAKHKIRFDEAVLAFVDDRRIIAKDEKHSKEEERLFCVGRVAGRVVTVRFTYRAGRIRIIGAGAWRKGRELYEEQAK